MKNKVHKTEKGWWFCPECGHKNEMFLIKDEKLPEVLHCSICNHESPELEWEDSQNENQRAES